MLWLRSALKNASEIVKVVDPDGTLRYASPAFEKVLGYDSAETVGTMNVLDHVHPDDLPRVLEATERALAEESVVSNVAEYRFRHADGSWRWVESVGTYLLDDPQVRGIVVNVRDVTGRREAEEAAREGERRLASVISNAHAYAYRCLNEPGWPNEYASDYALELTGYPPEDLLVGGKVQLGDLIVEEDRQRVWDGVQEAIAEGRGFELRYAIRRSDGRIRHVREYGQGVYGEGGEVVALEGLVYDITEHREAEERLREAEERLRGLADAAFEGLLIADGGVILEANRALTEMFGYALAEPVGRSALEFVVPEHRDLARRKIASGSEDPYDLVGVRKDGTRIDLEVRGRAYSYRGRSVRVTAVRDVTERKAAEEALREAEERYRTLVERIPAVTFVDRAEGSEEPVYVSPQVEGMLGYAPEEWMAGRLWRERLHPEDRERVLRSDERFDRDGEPVDEEYRLLAKDGRAVWVREETVLVRGEGGEPLFVQGILTDITERKDAERALRESEERFRGTFEDAPIGVALVGLPSSSPEADRRYLRVNPALCEMLGYSEEELLSMTTPT
ncbi:PAS domain-containing protein [Rubrobacter tropicus]|uniref:PAS domain-containing protein n=1 Tax=Rubrobacter tropicus TaxID=2653851 RepID=UPI00140B1B38|nr:PAS domain S-box protein [Rubrobacter tropicus]